MSVTEGCSNGFEDLYAQQLILQLNIPHEIIFKAWSYINFVLGINMFEL